MLAPEDLVDLGTALRRSGVDVGVATQQFLAAQHFLLRLAAEGALPPNRAGLEGYLGPIFCSSAQDQRRFGPAYRAWLRERFPEERDQVAPDPAPELPRAPHGPRKWVRPLVATLVVLATIGLWFSWQHWRPRAVEGVVTLAGEPVRGARVELGARSVETDGQGRYLLFFRAAELETTLRASSGAAEGSANLAREFGGRWRTLYVGAPLAALPVRVDITIAASAASEPESPRPLPVAPAPAPRRLAAQAIGSLEPGETLALPTTFERINWGNGVLVALPLLLFLVWYVLQIGRRPVLQRHASRTPPGLVDVHLAGGARAVARGYPLRRLAQELRRRRLIESSELRLEPTIAATLRHGGMFTAVRGSRVEPDYFALIDRATLSDHQARLAGEIVADLARSDVLVERYDFDRDASLCRLRDTQASTRLHPAPTPGRKQQPRAAALDDLHERFPERRVLVFGDGAGCFDAFSGAAAPWLATLRLWQFVVLVTPVPVERWGRREAALASLGVHVLPLTSEGLARLIEAIAAPSPAALGRAAGSAGAAAAPGLHERTPRRWLERQSPSESTVRTLCDDLRAELGARGFAWLAACAAYPEIHWGITMRLGAMLVADRGEFERLLPRLARLPWLREAYMPDWLRAALLERLDDEDEARLRSVLYRLLQAFAPGAGSEEVPLQIASAPASRDLPLWRRVRRALLRWWRRRTVPALISQADEDSPLRDYVFLRFLRGSAVTRIDLAAPDALARLARTGRRALLAPAAVGTVVALAAGFMLSSFLPVYDRLDYVRWTHGLAFSAGGRSVGAVTSVSARLPDGLLRMTAQRISIGPAESASTAPAANEVLTKQAVNAQADAAPAGMATRDYPGTRAALAQGFARIAVARDGRIEVGTADDREGPPRHVLESPGEVESLLFSPDGDKLAAGYRDGVVRVWDFATRPVSRAGKPIGPLPVDVRAADRQPLGRPVSLLSFSADGNRLAEGRNGLVTIRMRDGGVFEQPAPDGLTALAFDPAGALLAAAGLSGVRVWNVSSAASIDLKRPAEVARDVAFSADGARLAVAADGPNVEVFDTRTGERTAALDGHAPPVARVRFSPDGDMLATLDRAGMVRLYDARSYAVLTDAPLVARGGTADGGSFRPDLVFSEDGKRLAAARGGAIRVWAVSFSEERKAGPDPAPPTPAKPPKQKARSQASLESSKPSQCPAGAFFDPIDGGTCWRCPDGMSRSLFPVKSGDACERPLREEFARATRHGPGGAGQPCGAGQFWDPVNRYCWSCPSGYLRTLEPVTAERACVRTVAPARAAAQFAGNPGRNPGVPAQ